MHLALPPAHRVGQHAQVPEVELALHPGLSVGDPDARADSALVRLFCQGQLVKTHPRQQPGRRITDPADLPAEKTTSGSPMRS
jgi:hypothetical protein